MATDSRWPLAGFYACYFAVLGVWLPFWPLYLSHLGHSAETIGILTALAQWIKIPAPPLWGRVADRGAGRHTVILYTCLATLLAFCLFFLDHGLLWLALATVLYSLFHAAPLSLTDSLAMELCVRRRWDYGRIRLWGSWGFVVLTLMAGPMTDAWGIGIVPFVIAVLLLTGFLFAMRLPRLEVHPWTGPAPAIFDRPEVRWFYFSAFLMQFSHGAYYGFMSLHLQQHDFSRTAIGLLWAVGVVAEVGLMHRSQSLLDRFGISRLLTFSLLMAVVRWTLYASTLQVGLLLAGQLLHAFTFGAFHIAAVRRVYDMAPVNGRGAAQGWLSGLSYGAGGGLGMAVSGVLFDSRGSQILFGVMALAALAGVAASHRSALLFVHREPAHV
ncbi:MAG: MFS transporter [Magnetococcales bacterium]|nr:MFS transporter [Magnetococcales bacterium]